MLWTVEDVLKQDGKIDLQKIQAGLSTSLISRLENFVARGRFSWWGCSHLEIKGNHSGLITARSFYKYLSH